MNSIRKHKDAFYYFVDEHAMWKMKDDERLKEMEVSSDDVYLSTVSTGQTDWFGSDIRETLVVLK